MCKISIHAPANGATTKVAWHIHLVVFQSTLRRTERRSIVMPGGDCVGFQSTLRRTERLTLPFSTLTALAFQSTLRRTERPTSTAYTSASTTCISIHAPANGATHRERSHRSYQKFQSTLRRTERRCICNVYFL